MDMRMAGPFSTQAAKANPVAAATATAARPIRVIDGNIFPADDFMSK